MICAHTTLLIGLILLLFGRFGILSSGLPPGPRMAPRTSNDTASDAPTAADWQPRPSYDRLALHRWEMGQVLHPAQFRAQEEALLEQRAQWFRAVLIRQ